MKKIILADDHSIVRAALKIIVSDTLGDVEIVEARDKAEALSNLAQDGPVDLMMIDLRMPGMSGVPDVEEIVQKAGSTPVMVFTVVEDPVTVRAYLAAGVKAFVPKTTDEGQIGKIIDLVLAGGTYLPPVLTCAPASIAPGDRMDPVTPPLPEAQAVPTGGLGWNNPVLDDLTRRQREVLKLIATGRSNNDIAEELGLNLSTVKSHITAIFKVLGVESRTQAVLMLNGHGD